MAQPLDYGRRRRKEVPLAGWALLAGCFSGPLSFALTVAALFMRLPPGFAFGAMVAPLLLSLLFGCAVYTRLLRSPAPPRHRTWAGLSIFLSLAWTAIIFFVMLVLPSH